jgi:type IV secretory pathway VirB2 component (pilin)
MIQILMIAHALVAVALLGAITHQAFSASRRPAGAGSQNVVDRFRGVHSPAFTNTIIVLFVVSSLAGALLYPRYRIDVRTTLEDLQLRAANGVFEIKEHFAAVGLGLLPAYWLFWRPPLQLEYAATRKYLTWILAFLVWWNFLVGEVLNNIKGLFP